MRLTRTRTHALASKLSKLPIAPAAQSPFTQRGRSGKVGGR